MFPGRGVGGFRSGRRPPLPSSSTCLGASSASPTSTASRGFTQEVGRDGPLHIDDLGPVVAVQGPAHVGVQVQVERLHLLEELLHVLLQCVRFVEAPPQGPHVFVT